MAVLTNNDSMLASSITISKQLGTLLTLDTDKKYVDKDIQFNIGVMSGNAVAGSATADAAVQSGGVGNISDVIGSKQTIQPSTGSYIKIKVDASGYSKINTAGWMPVGNLTSATASETMYFPVANAEVTSGDATISGLTFAYNSVTDDFDISGSDTISAPTVVSSGYISSTAGSKNTNTATVQASVDKVVGAVTISGTSTKTPVISNKAITASGVTDAAAGAATTTTPSSGVYIAVQTAKSTGTLTATPSITTAGYGTATNNGLVKATKTVGAAASALTYVPITTANPSFAGGALSGTAMATGTSITLSESINNSGASISTECSVTRSAVNYSSAVSGWVDKESGETVLASATESMTTKTYYVNGVTLTKPSSGIRTFAVTVPNGDSTVTFNFNVDSQGNVTIN